MPKGNVKPKPPKKRKSFGRNQRGGNKKNSNYNYNDARQAMSLPKANHAQISQHATITGTDPPSEKSPLKSVYKAMLKEKVQETQTLLQEKEKMSSENEELKNGLGQCEKKISAQQLRIKELALLLQDEKKKSRAVIGKLMTDADSVIAEAHDIRFESEAKVSSVAGSLDKSKQRHKDALHKERQQHSNQVMSCEFYHVLSY